MTNECTIQDVEIPTLRIKRPHNKVRSGCATCKKARVKCDEKRPHCTRCCRKKTECSYFDRPRTSVSPPYLQAADTRINSDNVSSENSPHHAGDISPRTTRLGNLSCIPDIELAKHYLTHTVQTFAGGAIREDQSDMWQIFIPAVALTCLIVHQGMLTLAAICLYHDSSHDDIGGYCLEHLETAEAHGKIFVKESRQKMQEFQEGLNTQDQDSILACSKLLCVLGFAFFQTHRQNGTTLADPAAWTWLHLLRGLRTAYEAVVEAGRPVDAIFMNHMTPQFHHDEPLPRRSVSCKNPCFSHVQESWQEYMDALRSTFHRDWSFLKDHQNEDLGAAIDLLYQVTEQVCSETSQNLFRTITIWPAAIPKGFVDMLVDGSPPALAVYAHWLMLMVLVEDLWWVGDMGRAGIHDVIAMCSDADRVVHSLLTRPRQMLDMGVLEFWSSGVLEI